MSRTSRNQGNKRWNTSKLKFWWAVFLIWFIICELSIFIAFNSLLRLDFVMQFEVDFVVGKVFSHKKILWIQIKFWIKPLDQTFCNVQWYIQSNVILLVSVNICIEWTAHLFLYWDMALLLFTIKVSLSTWWTKSNHE